MTLSRPSMKIVERFSFSSSPLQHCDKKDKRRLTKYRRFAHTLDGASETGRRSAPACFGLQKITERVRSAESESLLASTFHDQIVTEERETSAVIIIDTSRLPGSREARVQHGVSRP